MDIRADIYSLGVTFYFLLSGRTPFDHGTTTEKLLWHQHKEPEPLHSLRKDAPRKLEAVVAQEMMAKKPAERYQQPIEVVEALRPWTERPIEPPPPEEMPRVCPALESIALSATGGVLSGSSGSSSSLRLPRSEWAAFSSRLSATPLTRARGHSNLWVGAGAFVAGLAALIWWTGRPIDSKPSPPLSIASAAVEKIKPQIVLPRPDVLPAAEHATRSCCRGRSSRSRHHGAHGYRLDARRGAGSRRSHGRIVVLDGPVEGQFRVDGARDCPG